MNLPPLTYLTINSMAQGVGRSQVVPYVERLAQRGVDVTLHSFERQPPGGAIRARLETAGVRWSPHPFGPPGTSGGLLRVARGAALVARADLVHARSDLPAASVMLARRRTWLWDVRDLWRDDYVAQGLLRGGSAAERVLERVETAAARSCTAIVALSKGAIEVLSERHGTHVASKSRVIPTCVDLGRFGASPVPPTSTLCFLLAGSLSKIYDVPLMMRVVERVRARRPAELTVLTPGPTVWDALLRRDGVRIGHAEADEMPVRISEHHVGLSVRFDVSVGNRAAVPTKLGEFLACGRPIVVNAGLGDMDELLSRHDCGVVVGDGSEADLERVADQLERLVEDPATPDRCRKLAEEHFDVDRGVDSLLAAYRQAVA